MYCKRKILPNCYPMISTYNYHANIMSILGNYPETYSWVISNFIQLYMNKDLNYAWGDFYFPFPYDMGPYSTCRWIYNQKIERCNVDIMCDSPISFIIDCINSNNYVSTKINHFYLPVSRFYKDRHFNHNAFIYGFDLDEEILYVADFFKSGKYSNEKISFSDFTQSFRSYNKDTSPDYINGVIYLFKFNSEYDYRFSIENITNSIRAYLHGDVPEFWNFYNNDERKNLVFGIQVYDTLKNYIIRKMSNKDSYIDIRCFYLLYEHKKLMVLRFKYLNELGYFKDINNNINISKLSDLEVKSQIIVNLILKYSFTRDTSLANRIVSLLEYIKIEECAILTHYIN